jgi:hypothetical protein
LVHYFRFWYHVPRKIWHPCNTDSEFIVADWIPYLASELSAAVIAGNVNEALVVVEALGQLGHPGSVETLVSISIEVFCDKFLS